MMQFRFGFICLLLAAAVVFPSCAAAGAGARPVTMATLLDEMVNREANSRAPATAYASLQASSYNRESRRRGEPGWFADSDGTGFIREEKLQNRTEYVMMEHDGPGCLTRMWTPFFYYDFNNRTGPEINIYLDGSNDPVIHEPFIQFVTGRGTVKPPFAQSTARAGDCYLPIPFARSCKITMSERPFYYIINYRVYEHGAKVETFHPRHLQQYSADIARSARTLAAAPPAAGDATIEQRVQIHPSGMNSHVLTEGPGQLVEFTIRPVNGEWKSQQLRSAVLSILFDGEQGVWSPVGDFFCSADSLHPFHTWERTAAPDGTLTSRWVMPYRKMLQFEIHNSGAEPLDVYLTIRTARKEFTDNSYYFHANWRPDRILPGTPFVDLNFIDIQGEGVFAGDALTVLNPTRGWWGEGDEKIYVNDAWDRGFPTHFGTGTEDYYGWAGGVVPVRADEFSRPFLANARVGGESGDDPRGYNICTRTRALDAIPFQQKLRFDMEASPGVDQRGPADMLGYSSVVFWYARPGAVHNAPPEPARAAQPVMNLTDIEREAAKARQNR